MSSFLAISTYRSSDSSGIVSNTSLPLVVRLRRLPSSSSETLKTNSRSNICNLNVFKESSKTVQPVSTPLVYMTRSIGPGSNTGMPFVSPTKSSMNALSSFSLMPLFVGMCVKFSVLDSVIGCPRTLDLATLFVIFFKAISYAVLQISRYTVPSAKLGTIGMSYASMMRSAYRSNTRISGSFPPDFAFITRFIATAAAPPTTTAAPPRLAARAPRPELVASRALVAAAVDDVPTVATTRSRPTPRVGANARASFIPSTLAFARVSLVVTASNASPPRSAAPRAARATPRRASPRRRRVVPVGTDDIETTVIIVHARLRFRRNSSNSSPPARDGWIEMNEIQ